MDNFEQSANQESCTPQTTMLILKDGVLLCKQLDSNDVIGYKRDPGEDQTNHFGVGIDTINGAPDAKFFDLTMPNSPDFLKKYELQNAVGKVHYTGDKTFVIYSMQGEAPMSRIEVAAESKELISNRTATEVEGRAILRDLNAVLQQLPTQKQDDI